MKPHTTMPMRVSVQACTGQTSGPAHRRASRCVSGAGPAGEHRDDQATRVQGDAAGQQSGGTLGAQAVVETDEYQGLIPGAVRVSGQERAIACSPSLPTAGVHHRHARRTNSRTPRSATSSAVRGTAGPRGRMPRPELEAHEKKRVGSSSIENLEPDGPMGAERARTGRHPAPSVFPRTSQGRRCRRGRYSTDRTTHVLPERNAPSRAHQRSTPLHRSLGVVKGRYRFGGRNRLPVQGRSPDCADRPRERWSALLHPHCAPGSDPASSSPARAAKEAQPGSPHAGLRRTSMCQTPAGTQPKPSIASHMD